MANIASSTQSIVDLLEVKDIWKMVQIILNKKMAFLSYLVCVSVSGM